MKKSIAVFFLLATMLVPAISSAGTTEGLQRQLISVLTQLITMLEARIAQLHVQGAVEAQSQTSSPQADMCPPVPPTPTGVPCSSEWQKIRDAQSCHVGWNCVVFTATVAGKSVQPPIISAIQGPTDVVMNTSGTWKVSATSPMHELLSYSIIWGDEGASVSQLLDLAAEGAGNFASSNSYSHMYSGQGIYTIIVFVKDEDGNTSKATMSVYVQPPPPPQAPAPQSSNIAETSCTIAGSVYPEGTRLSSADIFARGNGHSTFAANPHAPLCAYVIGPNPNYHPPTWPYYYTCRTGHWYNDSNVEYCSMLVPPALGWRYQYYVDIMPDFCRVNASPDVSSCVINGQQYQEGQSAFFGCSMQHPCPVGQIFPPGYGWRVCHNGSWNTSSGQNSCPSGYGWCGAGVGPAMSCMLLRGGQCPAIL